MIQRTDTQTAAADIAEIAIGVRTPDRTGPQISIEQNSHGAIAVRIETERLVIAPVTHSDTEDYHTHLFGNATVMQKYASGVTVPLRSDDPEASTVETRVTNWVRRWESGDPFGGFAIRLRSGEFIGHVVLGHGDVPGQSEIAYLIRHDRWRQGFGNEAAQALIHGLAPLLRAYGMPLEGAEFTRIEATARPDNPGSGGILVKAGMNIFKTSEKFGAHREHFELAVPLPDKTGAWEILAFEDRTIARDI